jgi:hypothetical protein
LEKTIVWIPVISTFCKIFIPSYTFDWCSIMSKLAILAP